MIPKPDNKGFRPISLAQCLMKLSEIPFQQRLSYFIETELIIPKTQFGFRKGKSCLDNIATLTTDIYNAYNGEFLGVVFIDIEGAYDNIIPSNILVENLKELRLPKNIIQIIKNLISVRSAKFYNEGR